MRENIGLFKAKRTDNGEWVEGWLRPIITSIKTIDGYYIMNRNGSDYRVDKETICEFTGLEDKNEKKIWENDIVESVSWNEYLGNDINLESLKRKLLVKYINGQLCLVEKFKDATDMTWDWSNRDKDTFEVIGNKFDNQESLRKE